MRESRVLSRQVHRRAVPMRRGHVVPTMSCSWRNLAVLWTAIFGFASVCPVAAEDAQLSLHLYAAPSTAPADAESAAINNPDVPKTEGGLVEFLATRFSAHEPIYFLWGPER